MGAETSITIRGVALDSDVLRRVVVALAAQKAFTVDRLNDVEIVVDIVARVAPPVAVDDALTVGIRAGAEDLVLRIGPVSAGALEQLSIAAEIPGLGSALSAIAGTVRRETRSDDPDHEFIVIEIPREAVVGSPGTL